MATLGRPVNPNRYYDPAFQRKLWLNKDGTPYSPPIGRPEGLLTLPNGQKVGMVLVIGVAEYYFYEARDRGAKITKKAAFDLALREILRERGHRESHAKRLSATAMRIHNDMIRRFGLLPMK